jgi:hypothetical protein
MTGDGEHHNHVTQYHHKSVNQTRVEGSSAPVATPTLLAARGTFCMHASMSLHVGIMLHDDLALHICLRAPVLNLILS